MTLFLLVLGLIFGAVVGDEEGSVAGALFGGLVGWLLARERKTSQQLALELKRLAEVAENQQRGLAQLWHTVYSEKSGAQPEPQHVSTPHPAAEDPVQPPATAEHNAPQQHIAQREEPQREAQPTGQEPRIPHQYPLDRAIAAVKAQLFGGNTVVRAGILVLLVGVTLLLKYAVDHELISIELRMAGAGLAGLALILVGLRVREQRASFGQTLQGGGVATMYLVIFFSFRSYQLLPPMLAFGLLAIIAALSAVLAVAQNAMALVVVGQLGGFLAPILASSGSGNHVALFSYYLLLNLMIAGVAWFRAWRPLNLIGFVFTFGIGTAWGALKYASENFATTEPFLVAFFLLYVAIPVLFATRGTAKGWVDGSLVFGAPLAFLALQLVLVRDKPFAMAYSAVGVAALYLVIATVLTRRAGPAFAAMRLAFIALGVGFATLAIPYAFDQTDFSAAAWAVEGAGLYFLGVRQQRALSRAAGVFLQLLAGTAIFITLGDAGPVDAHPFLHGRVLAVVFLACSSLFIAEHAHRRRLTLRAAEVTGLQLLVVWCLLVFLPTINRELVRVVPTEWLPGAQLGSLGLLGIVLEGLGRGLSWPAVRYAPACLAFLVIPITLLWHGALPGHLLAHGGAAAWPLYFASVYLTLRYFVPTVRDSLAILHTFVLFGATLWLGLTAYEVCDGPLALSEPWSTAALGFVLVGVLLLLTGAAKTKLWPVSAEQSIYLGTGRQGLAFCALGWALVVSVTSSGEEELLGYIPLLNPGELFQLSALAAVLIWRHSEQTTPRYVSETLYQFLPRLVGFIAFLCWNGLLARATHRYSGVRWDVQALWDESALQMAFAISWTLIGLLLTALASRRKLRSLWFAGASLLAVVVVKLFLLDLKNLSPVAKIATFLVVGVLLLVVGYFSPVPPARAATTAIPNPKTDSTPEGS